MDIYWIDYKPFKSLEDFFIKEILNNRKDNLNVLLQFLNTYNSDVPIIVDDLFSHISINVSQLKDGDMDRVIKHLHHISIEYGGENPNVIYKYLTMLIYYKLFNEIPIENGEIVDLKNYPILNRERSINKILE